MNIRHLQINTSLSRSPGSIIEFISQNNIDIACLQEVTYTSGSESPFKKLASDTGFFYTEGVHFCQDSNQQILAVAIISRWPFIDFSCNYYNAPDYEPKLIKEADMIGKNILADDEKTDNFEGSRGLKLWLKSRCILTALLNTHNGLLRVMTTHFTVSDHCTETIQMYEMSKLIKSLIKFSRQEIPTIFSGDLNIRPQSYSVQKISEVMTCHTSQIGDTLSLNHIARQHGFPNGLPIDHVFSRGLEYHSTQTIEVPFSEHKAVVSQFGL